MRADRSMVQRRSRGTGGTPRTAQAARDAVGPSAMDPATVTVHVPLAFRQRHGRKVLIAPNGAGLAAMSTALLPMRTQRGVAPAVRALARAFRWRRLLETGAIATVHEIAAAEKINPSYVSRVLRLTLLAPQIVEAVMEGRAVCAAETLDSLMLPFPTDWGRQTLLSY